MCVVPGMGMLAHVGGYLWRRCAEGNDEFDLVAGDSNLNLADRFSPSAQKKVTTDPERKSQAWRESINDLEEASRPESPLGEREEEDDEKEQEGERERVRELASSL